MKETDPEKKGGCKKWTFAQKNNNCISVRVTLRCGLLFASSVITAQSQRAVNGSLTNDYETRGGDGTLFRGLRQQYTTSHGTRCLIQRSDYYLHGPNKADAVRFWGKKQRRFVSCFPSFFFPKRFESRAATSRACLLDILLACPTYRGASVLRVCEPPKYLHADTQLHSMERKTSKPLVQNSSFIGLCNGPKASWFLSVSGALVCVFGWTDFLNPPVPLLPNDEQDWLWLC